MVEKHTREQHKEDLDKIREWLQKQHHLPQNIHETFLWRFLHTSNFSLEQCKHLIDLFYTIRSQAPEIFGNRDPTDTSITECFKIMCIMYYYNYLITYLKSDLVPLPKPTKDDCKILIFRLADPDPDKYNYLDSLRSFFMMADTRLITETQCHSGEIPIFDMEGFSLRHLTKITLPIMKKYMTYTQEAHPIRLRQIHILNTPPFLDRCLSLVRPFMKSEVGAMLNFHLPNSQTLYDYVPRDLLPVEYGGSIGKISEMKKVWVQRVMANRDFFRDETRWRVDEKRRPAANQNGKQMFGIQGSFRALSID